MAQSILNKRGSSLVEILMAIGLISMLAMIIAQMFVDSRKQFRLIEAKQDQIDFMTAARLSFMVPAQCIDNMQSITFNSAQLSPGATTNLQIGSFRVNGTTLQLTKLALLKVESVSFKSISQPTANSSLGELEFGFDYISDSSTQMKLANKKMPLYVRVDGTGRVVECGQSISASPTVTPTPASGSPDAPCPSVVMARTGYPGYEPLRMRLPEGVAGQFVMNQIGGCSDIEKGMRDQGWICQYGQWTAQAALCGDGSGGGD